MTKQNKDTFKVMGEDLVKQLKMLLREGNIRRIIIKDEEGKNTYLEIPVTIGVIGAVLIPVLAVAGVLAVMVGVVTIEVVRTKTPAKKAKKAAPKKAAKKGEK
jgi:Domain of unknown function (DUF4342)